MSDSYPKFICGFSITTQASLRLTTDEHDPVLSITLQRRDPATSNLVPETPDPVPYAKAEKLLTDLVPGHYFLVVEAPTGDDWFKTPMKLETDGPPMTIFVHDRNMDEDDRRRTRSFDAVVVYAGEDPKDPWPFSPTPPTGADDVYAWHDKHLTRSRAKIVNRGG